MPFGRGVSKLGLQDELKKVLLGYRVPIEMMGRFVVMQNQKPVDALHPLTLMKHIESCLGTESIRQRIVDIEKQEAAHREQCLQLTEKIQMSCSYRFALRLKMLR